MSREQICHQAARVNPETQVLGVILSPSTDFRINSAKRGIVILSRAKDLEILRRLAPQNDSRKHGFRTETS